MAENINAPTASLDVSRSYQNISSMVTNSNLHHSIIKYIIDVGYAPDISQLATLLDASTKEIEDRLYALQECHGIVLHPHNPKVWVIHPFSLAPTNFIVNSQDKIWWGNCAWCSLGIAALLKTNTTITTRIAAYDKQITINIIDGNVLETDLFVHFPIPMKKAWDNVIYTCSTMLIFENEMQVADWSLKHNIPQGDIQPISNIWEFSKEWYGNLSPIWEKWTAAEAKHIFQKYNLTHKTWDLEESASRF